MGEEVSEAHRGAHAARVPNPAARRIHRAFDSLTQRRPGRTTRAIRGTKFSAGHRKRHAGRVRSPPPKGHKDMATTQIYAHVIKQPGIGVRSPLDGEGSEARGARRGEEESAGCLRACTEIRILVAAEVTRLKLIRRNSIHDRDQSLLTSAATNFRTRSEPGPCRRQG
jgi:hypothetical protein